VKDFCQFSLIDHHLVAKTQACVTGANAHDVHALLGNYYELCLIAQEDESIRMRVAHVEQRLRSFCLSGELTKTRIEYGTN
jgi:hypothetical protein